MIRIQCPGCGSSLNAKRSLIGQTRQCPKCSTPITIAEPGPGGMLSQREALREHGGVASCLPAAPPREGMPPAVTHAEPAAAEALPVHHWPERLERTNVYLICGRAKLAALWQNNGEGWMLRTNTGYVSALRNRDQLPSQGDFRLVELKLETKEAGRHLIGLMVYQLAARWALTSLERGDDAICAKIAGPGGLNKDQKNVVRNALKELFMYQVWERADRALEYLGNTDYHSPGT